MDTVSKTSAQYVQNPKAEKAECVYCQGETAVGQYPRVTCQLRQSCARWHAWQAKKDEPDARLVQVFRLPYVPGHRCHYFNEAAK